MSQNDSRDRELGMQRSIMRRDFLNGAALGAGGVLAHSWLGGLLAAETLPSPQNRPGYYPPMLSGMRGSHPGSFEMAHALRDGTEKRDQPVDTGEQYDLVIVGGGISGLAAAYFIESRPGLQPAFSSWTTTMTSADTPNETNFASADGYSLAMAAPLPLNPPLLTARKHMDYSRNLASTLQLSIINALTERFTGVWDSATSLIKKPSARNGW